MNKPLTLSELAAARPLSGRVSLITGSTSGIGLGIARALAAAGSAVVLNGFGKPEEIAATQAKLAEEFVTVHIRRGHVEPGVDRGDDGGDARVVGPGRHSRQ
jgi:NAD(P)-dependent dehydrogenase (short-subunit alcohol dehydrogenase family)